MTTACGGGETIVRTVTGRSYNRLDFAPTTDTINACSSRGTGRYSGAVLKVYARDVYSSGGSCGNNNAPVIGELPLD